MVLRLPQKKSATMSKDMALKVLGLSQTKGNKKQKKITELSEDEILGAFQQECHSLSKFVLRKHISSSFLFPALEGRSSDLQNCHEAYQVLVKVIRAKNNFLKRAEAKKEKQNQIMGQVEKASSIWKQQSSLINNKV